MHPVIIASAMLGASLAWLAVPIRLRLGYTRYLGWECLVGALAWAACAAILASTI